MSGQPAEDIILIGAGITGITAALALQSQGRKVLVIDRADGALKASERNAGAFAFPEVEPLATPGIMAKAPKWLLDPLGPLSVPPAYALKITPWLLRFWRASRPDRYHQVVSAQVALMALSKDALETLIREMDASPLIHREGQLQLYEGVRDYRASLASWDLRREYGIAFELLETPEAIAEIQPGLDRRFTHAGFTPEWMNTSDPARWLTHLRGIFLARGGRIEPAEVSALRPQESAVLVQSSSDSRLTKQVVLCAGAWSHRLAATLGDRIPLETERGYNTSFAEAGFDLKTHLTFSRHGFVVSRLNQGVKIGGAVELGGLDLPPNFKRAEILVSKAKAFLPGLKTQDGEQWMGFRPSLPDSLPVISRSPNEPRVVYAFGHGHLGLTQSAGTARLVAALVQGAAPAIPIGAFAADRF